MNDQQNEILRTTAQFVKSIHEHDSSGHDWWHIVRVTRLAGMLAAAEGGDEYIIRLAALLHDAADEKLNPSKEAGLAKVRDCLRQAGVREEDQEQVLQIIESVSFGGGDRQPPETLEGRIVQDADRLDAMGAIGIARTFAYSGWKGQGIYDPFLNPRDVFTKEEYRKGKSTAINHFFEKLLKLKSMMNTETARAFAEHRHERLRRFLWEFDSEWGLANEAYLDESVFYRGKIQRVHVTFDESSYGTIKMVLKDKTDEVVVMLHDNLMIGPLPDHQDPHSAAKRKEWYLRCMGHMENKSEIIEMFIRSHMAWKLTPPQLTPYPVLVWAGESASEQTGLRRLMSVLPLTADVSILNTTQLLSSEKFQYTCTGEISSEKLRQILGLEISMSAEAKTALAEDWERLTAEKGLLRIWKDGRLSSVPESYFDFRIMEAAAELGAFRGEFRKSARIIGQVIGYSEQRLSDEFIQARVKQLIEEGVFTYQGDLSSMRYYSISLTEAGLAELQLEQKNPD